MVATPARPVSSPRREPRPDPDVCQDVLDRPSRRDALPEHTHYADTGCDLHPSCLTCPLVRCRYDEPGGARKLAADKRDQRILRLYDQEELPINDIARQFGISRRTVFRVLARSKARQAN